MNNPNQFWDNRYAETAYAYGTQPNVYFRQQLDTLVQPGRLLLLAEGEGRNAVYAAQQGWQVTAVDFSPNGREKALALAREHGVTFEYIVQDIAEFDFSTPGTWDAIALIYAHFPPALRTAVHQKCAEALAPGGKIIIEAFHERQLGNTSGGPQTVELLFSKALLEREFAGLEALEITEQSVVLEEGQFHAGPAEVVRAFFEKI